MNPRLAPLQHFHLLSCLLQDLHHVQFTALETDTGCADFCRQHFFHPMQKEFTSAGLSKLIQLTDSNTVIHAADYFRIHIILFRIEETAVIMGPFCPLLFSQKDARILLSEHGLPLGNDMDFLSYASTYPFLTEQLAQNIVHAILHSIYPADDNRTIIPIDLKSVRTADEETKQMDARANYALLLEKRYSYEQRFRKDIMTGNKRAALLNLANMEQDVSYLKRIGSTLENEKIGAAITRTTARLAAIDGGLPGIIADQISNQNTKDTLAAKTVDEILNAKQNMICSYCTAIRAARTKSYSVLVQGIFYAIEHKFHDDISICSLADELAISKNYLIKRFKAETGQTPGQYLTQYRLKRAAMLLAEHELSVQDIANAVGIPDANYFTKLFKKYYHMTPIQYRKSRIV